jgi:hypothetical protein
MAPKSKTEYKSIAPADPVPAGWEVVKQTRKSKILQRSTVPGVAAVPVVQLPQNDDDIDELASMMRGATIGDDGMDALISRLGHMEMGGRKRRRTRKARKSRKASKKSRKHRA